MKNILFSLTSLALLVSGSLTLAGQAGDGIIGDLRLGMTEAELNEMYPAGEMPLEGGTVIVEGRFGDFRRGEETFEGGLTMFKLRPANADSREACQSFFDNSGPMLTGQFGEPVDSSANEDTAFAAWQASWDGPGLRIQLEAIWYGEQSTCAAEIFVRPTDIEPL